jgi:hypothetical protein
LAQALSARTTFVCFTSRRLIWLQWSIPIGNVLLKRLVDTVAGR